MQIQKLNGEEISDEGVSAWPNSERPILSIKNDADISPRGEFKVITLYSQPVEAIRKGKGC